MKKYILSLITICFSLAPLFSFAQENLSSEYYSSMPGHGICLNFVNNLKYQDKDKNRINENSTLQGFLMAKGYYGNWATGYFDSATLDAVKSFQKANNISATGYVGPNTRAKIQELSCVQTQEQACCEVFATSMHGPLGPPSYEMISRNQCSTRADHVGDARSIVDKNYCLINSSKPIITDVIGPMKLRINQEATWRVSVFDFLQRAISYSIDWGDENYIPAQFSTNEQEIFRIDKYSMFTHSYAKAGSYTPKFTVTNTNGESITKSLSLEVGDKISYSGDLALIDFSWAPIVPSVKQIYPYITFTAYLKNVGTEPIFFPKDMQFNVLHGDELVAGMGIATEVFTLAPNEVKDLTINSTQSPELLSKKGTFNIKMTADINNVLQEKNKNNNSLTKKITISD